MTQSKTHSDLAAVDKPIVVGITVDDENANVFDDGFSITKVENGWQVYVAIADVASLIDVEEEAYKLMDWYHSPQNYILPRELKNNVSLVPEAERSALIMEIIIGEDGKIYLPSIKMGIFKSVSWLVFQALNYL